ncbi:phosphoheptose isomerase [Pelagibaculum spongiae]|uniref:Phosphoheptose isomerase n=1 Tax=Pelagibaculum spongiae TaxID=2080658 RepID=A0A2V1H090_9GAMM|nr:phosphoheptose isomerase [Pelagibaculum spongiae]PVZ71883.1 phosphoheptose isomerase [Pelagibaculum spongiae]
MDLTERIRQSFSDSIQAKIVAADEISEPIAAAADLMVQCLIDGKKIVSCGNGGSTSNAQLFTAGLLNRFETERPSLPAMTLTSELATITAIGNDYGFSEIFAKQLRALGQEGDILLAISTSGDSANLVEVIEAAHEREMVVIALTGKTGGEMAERLSDNDVEIRVPCDSTPRIQEVHMLVIHSLCDLIDNCLFGFE